MMFKTLFHRQRKPVIPEDRLPTLHSFANVTVATRPMRSVSVEELTPAYLTVGHVVGRPGEHGTFIYQNAAGKFRFSTVVAQVKDGMTVFHMPARVDAYGAGGSQKRSNIRLDTLVQGTWRMAPGGKGVGQFMKGSIRDISRGGCAIITDRQCRVGQWLEVKMMFKNDASPVTAVGEIMRCEQVPTSGKHSHGLRFHGVSPQADHAILEFINRRQAELRSRGLA